MLELVLFILSAHGLTQILCYGKIFDQWRPKNGKWGQLFSCTMCMGFWVGLFLGGIDPFTRLFSLSANFVDIFLMGLISSATSYILDKIITDEGIQIHKRWS